LNVVEEALLLETMVLEKSALSVMVAELNSKQHALDAKALVYKEWT
jgi:hypothetical protein